jgi:RNA polymerase sigma factor (sigma-70 family)
MPSHRLTDVVRRAAGLAGRYATVADRDLLVRFVVDRDADGFAELVRRHGAMVRAVCQRTLENSADTDEACQAVFLVLARKAASVRRSDAVGSWLYGVARRTALRVRSTAARRREVPLIDLPGPDTSADVTWRDGLRVLDEELARLADAYRAPLVLCYLEGRTQDEAARQLGWTLGAFRGRLERGRARLRARLDRRGVGLAVLAAVLAAEPTAGAFPVGMVSTIVSTATAVAAGEAIAVPVSVAALAEGVVRAMTMTKLSWAASVVAVGGMLTVGGLWATGQGLSPIGGEQPSAGAGRPAAEAPAQPPVERQADSAQRTKSLNNLKHIMLAVHNYEAAHGYLPADIRGKDGKPLLSWRVALLPFMDQNALYQQFKLDEPWDSEHNLKLLGQMPAIYRVGFEPKGSTHTYYQVFAGVGTPLHPTVGRPDPRGAAGAPAGSLSLVASEAPPAAGREAGPAAGGTLRLIGPRVRFVDIIDGTSNTFGVVEAGPPVPWTKPADIPFDPKTPVKLVGPFGNEWHATTMDGASYALKRDLSPAVLSSLIVMNDGQVIPLLKEMLAPRLADTPADKTRLRKLVNENQRIIDQLRELMREHAELLGDRNEIGAVEEMADGLKRMKDDLEAKNRRLRLSDDQRVPPKRP